MQNAKQNIQSAFDSYRFFSKVYIINAITYIYNVHVLI